MPRRTSKIQTHPNFHEAVRIIFSSLTQVYVCLKKDEFFFLYLYIVLYYTFIPALQFKVSELLEATLCCKSNTDYLNDPICFESASPYQSPCESFPCQHGGTCQALYETDDYRCTCTKNYTGRNCENFKGVLLTSFCEFYH